MTMTDEDGISDADIYDEHGAVRSDFLTEISDAIDRSDRSVIERHVVRLHESELGDLLEALPPPERLTLVRLLGDEFDMTALTQVDEAIRMEIVDQMPNDQIAAGIGELDSDDAVYILEDLDQDDRDEILSQLPFTERVRLRFQGDMFNVFNHPNFGAFGGTLNAATFGTTTNMANAALGAGISGGSGFNPIFNTGGPRNFQFALKLYF